MIRELLQKNSAYQVIRASGIKKEIISIAVLIAVSFQSEAQIKGSFVDVRDGQTYETVTYTITSSEPVVIDQDEYGTFKERRPVTYEIVFDDAQQVLTWMAEDLNYEMVDSECARDADADCKLYGRLYRWGDAKNACPEGWHLPSDNEWYLLAFHYGGVASAGAHLKSTSFGGTNKSQFNVKKPTVYWSIDEIDEGAAYDWKVNARWVKLQRWRGGKDFYNAVRCVQDY